MARRRTRRGRTTADPVVNADEVTGQDETARLAWKRWRQGRSHLRDWRTEAVENYDFVAGHQWAQDDLTTLKEQQRVPITFNRTEPVIAAVSGYEINGRQEVTFLPREPNDTAVAEVETAAVKYFRQECDAEDEESDQFQDALVTGLGWTEHRMDYDENPDGMMKVERVDGLEMVYDPASTRRNLLDRRWDIRGKWWEKSVAEDKWPDHDFSGFMVTPYADDDQDGNQPIDRIEASFYRSPNNGTQDEVKKDRVFILEMTWFESEPFYTVANPATGKAEDVTPKVHKALQDKLEAAGADKAPSVKRTRRVFKRAFVHGPTTLNPDDLEAPCPKGFHYQAITGKRDRNKNVWFGIVRAMKDPQRWANKWLSQFLHMLNTNVKNGVWYEKGAVDRQAEIEDKVGKPGFVIGLNVGFLEKVRKEEPTPIPNDAFNLMEYAISSVRDATGINVEMLGMADRNQPGVLEAQRKQSAMTILAPLFNAQRHYRKQAGRLELYFIRTYLSDGRMIRIVGDDGARYVPLAKREDTQEYDIVVDQSPSAPNQKEAVFGVLAQIMPILVKAGAMPPPEVLKYVPGLPATLADKWIASLSNPDPKKQQAADLELADKAADVQKKGADAELSLAKAGATQQQTIADMALLLGQVHAILTGQAPLPQMAGTPPPAPPPNAIGPGPMPAPSGPAPAPMPMAPPQPAPVM